MQPQALWHPGGACGSERPLVGTCDRDGEGAARAAHRVLEPRQGENGPTFGAEVKVGGETGHVCHRPKTNGRVERV